jgi:transketolase
VSTLDKNIIRDGVKKGAYTALESDNPDAVIFTTGSELHLALSIVEELNHNIKIVNIPCWELFEEQSENYKNDTLTNGCKKRISIEAGTTLGWEKFVGKDGLKIGVDNFGLSAPGTDVAQHFNFTKENIKNKIEEYLSE